MAGRKDQIKKITAGIFTLVPQTARKVLLDIDRRVVKRTPVDTGRARGNWLPAAENPDRRTLEVGESRDTDPASMAIDSKFPVLYLSNNLPYIEKLENGHSSQVPIGFVKLSVAEVAKKYK